jgi:antirestriction protein ArdC
MAARQSTAGNAPGNQNKPRETYDRLVASFIAQLEAGTAPWVRPWSTASGATEGMSAGMPQNAATGRPYHGVNVLLLWAAEQAFGYPSHRWLTYHQAKELGGHVRRGEHGQVVVYFKPMVKTVTNEAGEDEEQVIRLLRAFTAFNVAQ